MARRRPRPTTGEAPFAALPRFSFGGAAQNRTGVHSPFAHHRDSPAMNSHRLFAFALLAFAASLFSAAAAERPNVLFILCDDIRPYALVATAPPTSARRISIGSPPKASASRTPSAPPRFAPQAGLRFSPVSTPTITACATISRNSRRRSRTGRSACTTPATPPPTSANGTWVKTTTPRAPASIISSPTRGRGNTSIPSGTSTTSATRPSRATTPASSPTSRLTG